MELNRTVCLQYPEYKVSLKHESWMSGCMQPSAWDLNDVYPNPNIKSKRDSRLLVKVCVFNGFKTFVLGSLVPRKVLPGGGRSRVETLQPLHRTSFDL